MLNPESSKYSEHHPDFSAVAVTGNAALLADTLRVAELARELGALALELRTAGLTVQHKPDGSKVTNADLEISRQLETRLLSIRDVPVLSEESIGDFLVRHQCTALSEWWLVDPIDGTASFEGGFDGFAISIALMKESRPVAGVIAAPALSSIYYATEGLGAWKIHLGTGIENRLNASADESAPFRFAGYYHSPPQDNARLLAALQAGGISAAEITPVAAALKYCEVSEGTSQAAGGFRDLSIWDLAAADVIVHEAGGSIAHPASGVPFAYNPSQLRLEAPFAFGANCLRSEGFPQLQQALAAALRDSRNIQTE